MFTTNNTTNTWMFAQNTLYILTTNCTCNCTPKYKPSTSVSGPRYFTTTFNSVLSLVCTVTESPNDRFTTLRSKLCLCTNNEYRC